MTVKGPSKAPRPDPAAKAAKAAQKDTRGPKVEVKLAPPREEDARRVVGTPGQPRAAALQDIHRPNLQDDRVRLIDPNTGNQRMELNGRRVVNYGKLSLSARQSLGQQLKPGEVLLKVQGHVVFIKAPSVADMDTLVRVFHATILAH